MSDFPCTSCGACCKSIKGIAYLMEYDRGDGCCKYLDFETNHCTIYEIRPLLCNIDKAYKQLFSSQISLKEYYHLNGKACNELQQQLQLPLNFRVKF